MAAKISVVLLVKDESDRLPGALGSVGWADEVLVVDTGSSDGTAEVARAAGARVVEIPWEGYVASRNRAISLAAHDWVFFVDADERAPEALRDEILGRVAADGETLAGLLMPRLSNFLGRPVRHGAWYPDVQFRMGRRSRGFRVVGGRVHETYVADGPVARLRSPLHHEPYRNLSDYLRKSAVYARLAAEDRAERGDRSGPASILLRPPFEFVRSFLLKGGFLDGAAGAQVAFVHAWYYLLRAAYLREIRRDVGASTRKAGGRR
ncbi:MAG TPA: glycosyltransferase family 2 protein [Thermoanaerobaculia bacterium]|nr:glycosyltransferase family 2 protein [Thermoanaerobaculia bacterium]